MPENIHIKSDGIKTLERGQAVVEAKRPVEGEVKILSVTASAAVRPTEVFAGEVRYSGKVRFDCLAVVDGKTECICTAAEFSDRIAAPDLTAGAVVTLAPEVVNTEASFDGGQIKLVAVVDVEPRTVVHGDYECMPAPEQGIYAEKKNIEYSAAVAHATETLYVSDSVSDIKAAEAICPMSRAVVTSVECGDDDAKLSGAVYTTLLLRGEDGAISTYRLVTPFVKSVAVSGAHSGDTAYAAVCVADSVVTFTADDGVNNVELAVTLAADVTVMRSAETEIITDVFCAENVLDVTTETLGLYKCEPSATVIDSIDGQVPLDPDRPAADGVICVTNTFCSVTSAKVENGCVVVEGLAGGDIVYTCEKDGIDTLAFRIPFSVPLDIHTECENVDVSAVVTDVSVRVRRESVFDVKVETAFTARTGAYCETVAVKSVKRGEEIVRPDATVIVHIARAGETLWQAAKALCCSPERVMEQNSATAPYAGGERLVNFCSK